MTGANMERSVEITRVTAETEIRGRLALDGVGLARITTGIGFYDHLWSAFARHAGVDLELTCAGDLHVDDHHTAEDCALAIGAALDQALGERRGICRFGSAYAPLDEALCRAVLDLSGRPHAEVHLTLRREALGGLATENVRHALRSFAIAARATLHVDTLRAENDHHEAEAAFKALALATRMAIARRAGAEAMSVPSTKGVL
jgi:imidazoleglycerol phosphate dehydratase HisB